MNPLRVKDAGFFRDDTMVHFREEEEIIFPLVVDATEAREPLQRALLEHVEIHAAVHSLDLELEGGAPGADGILRIVDLFESHIRFEEKVVFPLVESISSAASLESVTLSQRNRATVTT